MMGLGAQGEGSRCLCNVLWEKKQQKKENSKVNEF